MTQVNESQQPHGSPISNVEFPHLHQWLEGAPALNTWNVCLNEQDRPDFILEPMEQICSILDSVQPAPNRLSRKKRDFKFDLDKSNGLNLRVELLVAANLTSYGLTYEFGEGGEPDFEVLINGSNICIEVTTRSKDDLVSLEEEIQAAVGKLPLKVILETEERLLEIPEFVRGGIVKKILEISKVVTGRELGTSLGTLLPEIAGNVRVIRIGTDDENSVAMKNGALLTNLMDSIEEQIVFVSNIKHKQAIKGNWNPNTILIVDLSRLSWSWLRGSSMWLGVLQALGFDWDSLPFLGVAVIISDLSTTEIQGAFTTRPNLSREMQMRIQSILNALNISSPY